MAEGLEILQTCPVLLLHICSCSRASARRHGVFKGDKPRQRWLSVPAPLQPINRLPVLMQKEGYSSKGTDRLHKGPPGPESQGEDTCTTRSIPDLHRRWIRTGNAAEVEQPLLGASSLPTRGGSCSQSRSKTESESNVSSSSSIPPHVRPSPEGPSGWRGDTTPTSILRHKASFPAQAGAGVTGCSVLGLPPAEMGNAV